jgi:hypothetical protein
VLDTSEERGIIQKNGKIFKAGETLKVASRSIFIIRHILKKL